jgi:hypothetical protein
MFEPQDHPNDFASPGGPPIPPYDNAGWTPAFQAGIDFDRVLDGFDGPFERVDPTNLVKPIAATVEGSAAGYVLPAAQNDSVIVANRALKAGGEVHRITSGPDAGGYYVVAGAATTPVVTRAAAELGVAAKAGPRPASTQPLKAMRIGLADVYGGNMPSGWIRWLLEQFEFDSVKQVYPQEIDAGNLNAKYDVLVFADGILPESDGAGPGLFGGRQPSPERVGPELAHTLGRFSVARSVPAIRAFAEAGGKVIAIGESTSLGHHLGLVDNHLVERTANGPRNLGRDKYYVPGSVLRAETDPAHPLAWGVRKDVDVMHDNSRVFELKPNAPQKGVTAVAWYPNATPLRSGWAWGQHYLEGGVIAAEAKVGQGKVMLFGPEITFRAQPHGTFKFLFNGIWR